MIGAAAVLTATWALPAWSQDRAAELIKQSTEATRKVQSLQADVEMGNGTRAMRGTLALKRPNLARVDMRAAGSFLVSDGKSVFNYSPQENEYQKTKADPTGTNVRDLWGLTFFQPGRIFKAFGSGAPTHAGTEKVDGVEYDVVESVEEEGSKVRFFISRVDSLVHRIEQVAKVGDDELKQTLALKNVRINPVISDTVFKWTPPKSAKLYEPPDFEKSLIAVGKAAPDFLLDQPGGGRLALSTAIKGKKATLVNFWFYG
jgi:outer membrane lipoprotein-sorting protein